MFCKHSSWLLNFSAYCKQKFVGLVLLQAYYVPPSCFLAISLVIGLLSMDYLCNRIGVRSLCLCRHWYFNNIFFSLLASQSDLVDLDQAWQPSSGSDPEHWDGEEEEERRWTFLLFSNANERRNGSQLLACRVCLPCSMLCCLDIVGGQNSRLGIQ